MSYVKDENSKVVRQADLAAFKQKKEMRDLKRRVAALEAAVETLLASQREERK